MCLRVEGVSRVWSKLFAPLPNTKECLVNVLKGMSFVPIVDHNENIKAVKSG